MIISPLQAHKRDLTAMRRRNFLKLGAGAALAMPFVSRSWAQTKELTIANFGGDAVEATKVAYGDPFTKETGIAVRVDGASPLPGKIKAMVDSGNIVWDVCDGDGFTSEQLGKAGVLEEIDYSIVNRSMIRPGFVFPYGVHTYSYSYVLAYDKTKFPNAPPTFTDFFDDAKYPGKRTLWKYQCGATEPCLLAAGVKPSEIYSIAPEEHLKIALEKAKSLGNDIVYWDSGADSQQMFIDEEVVMGVIWSSRAANLEKDTGGRVTWTWSQGLFCPGAYVIPKGAPAGKDAQRFIASVLIPERQIVALEKLAQGPGNPAAEALETDAMKHLDPGFAPNFEQQIARDEAWYAKNYDTIAAAWFDGIAN
ncbi:ABC transporter substrate-binding protein [Mesorhizobium sp. IMUNJ 23033]|uniref:ABC transporter substrate-binding protein n=1 Tax=Mesorhizobium sp. IMUNJ 23033 TaxID=3378039 RepID=UPI0038505917